MNTAHRGILFMACMLWELAAGVLFVLAMIAIALALPSDLP